MSNTVIPFTSAILLALGLAACGQNTPSGNAPDAGKSPQETASDPAKATGNAVGSAAEATGNAVGKAARVTGTAVSDAAKATGSAVHDGTSASGTAVGDAARATRNAVGVAANAVGDAAKATGTALNDASKATGEFLSQSKARAVTAAQETLDGIEKKWQALQAKTTPTTVQARADLQRVTDQMTETLADAKARLVEAKDASVDVWQQNVKPALDAALQKAQMLYEDASAKFAKE